jgi:hypothetical protein
MNRPVKKEKSLFDDDFYGEKFKTIDMIEMANFKTKKD